MSDQNDSNKKPNSIVVDPASIDKSKFGSLKPLTAVQVVSLLIKSDMAFCACACGGACGGGPCY